jgi:hypothetical protein
MPTLIKSKTQNSPGIISFTHNEALWGVPAKYPYIKKLLNDKSLNKEWIFLIHIQGDCGFLNYWPREIWHSCILWLNKNERFLERYDKDKILPYTCVNFLNEFDNINLKKKWDICIISRASSIKRIIESLEIVRRLMTSNNNLTFLFIVPDSRIVSEADSTYSKNKIEKLFFDLPLKIFTSKELKNITFISSSQQAFGRFPLQDHLISSLLAQSKFLFLNSYKEGVPRVIGEALLNGTPCIVSKNLKSGLNSVLNSSNTIFIDDDIDLAVNQILDGIANYSSFKIDLGNTRNFFSYKYNIENFKRLLINQISRLDLEVNGEWHLYDLPQRLACHGMKHNYQIMNNDILFLDWFKKVDNYENISDSFFDELGVWSDLEKLNMKNYKFIMRKKISSFPLLYKARIFFLKIIKSK